MIDLIIPCYNAHDTIERALFSVAIQTEVKNIRVLLINDASEKDYSEVIKKFKGHLEIEEIKHEKNLGVGFARQTGLNAVKAPYFAFMDSDDIFTTSFAFKMLKDVLDQDQNCVLVSGSFLEELPEGGYTLKTENMYWTFAKLYRTDFVRRNNISFPPQNQNEDNIFNMLIKLCIRGTTSIKQSKDPLYLWQYKSDSITRKNNHQYWFHTDVIGVLKGLYHIKENPNINQSSFIQDAVNFLFIAFFRYHDSKKYRPQERWNREILKETKSFYRDIIKPANLNFTDNIIEDKMKLVVKEHQKEFQKVEKFKEFIKLLEN